MAFSIALNTMAVFFLILGVGFVAGKLGIIARDSMPNLAKLITSVLLPVQLFFSVYTGTTRQTIIDNVPMIALSIAFYACIAFVTFALSKLLRLPHDKDRVFMLCFMFGNTGFVGFPLLSALFPDTGMLYLSLFSVVDQALFWTLGVCLATAREHGAHFHLKSILSPNIVSMAVVFAFVLLDIPLPQVALDTLETIGGATSALCMMYLGAMVCFSSWTSALARPELYIGVIVKMIIAPIVATAALHALGAPDEMASALAMIVALPVMTVVPMVAESHGSEGEYATGITAATLVFCVATIPLVSYFVL